MSSTNFLNTFPVRDTYGALKAAKYAGVSVAEEYVEMMDAVYALGLKDCSKDAIEGLWITVQGDSKILTFLEKMEGGYSVVPVNKVMVAFSELDRINKLAARLVQSDIGRPLVPRTADRVYEHATIGELQANLRLVGVFTMSDDRLFLKETLRTAPRLLVTATAIEEVKRVINAKEAVKRSSRLPYVELGFKVHGDS